VVHASILPDDFQRPALLQPRQGQRASKKSTKPTPKFSYRLTVSSITSRPPGCFRNAWPYT
jgi:hypothetical protein